MNNNTNERLGQNIREIRKRKGFTQQYIADHVGITKQSICKIEKYGTANQTTIERIANALFVDVKELYEPIPKEKSCTNEKRDFITIEEKEATIHEEFVPIMKHINDIVAKRFADMITEQCRLSLDEIEQLLKQNGYHADSYTPKEVYQIGQALNNEFLFKVRNILNDTSNP